MECKNFIDSSIRNLYDFQKDNSTNQDNLLYENMLPAEIWKHIASYLPLNEILKLGLCNKFFEELSKADDLWHLCFKKEYPFLTLNKSENAKNKYIQLRKIENKYVQLRKIDNIKKSLLNMIYIVNELKGPIGYPLNFQIRENLLFSRQLNGSSQIYDLKSKSSVQLQSFNTFFPLHCYRNNDLQIMDNQIYLGTAMGSIDIWDINKKKCITTFKNHKTPIACLEVNNSFICSASFFGKKIKIRDTSTKELIASLKGHTQISSLQLKENFLYSGSRDGTINVWDLNTKTNIDTLSGHKKNITSLQIGNDLLYSGSWDQTIKIWDLKTLQLKHTLNSSYRITSLKLIESILFVGCTQNIVGVWNVDTQLDKPTEINVVDPLIFKSRKIGRFERQEISCFQLVNHTLYAHSLDGSTKIFTFELGM